MREKLKVIISVFKMKETCTRRDREVDDDIVSKISDVEIID